MRVSHTAFRTALGMSLALGLACGGGSPSSPSVPTTAPSTSTSQLIYTDATTGTVRLVKNTSLSTPTHLVMDVIGTAAATLSAGLFVTLNVEPTVAQWTKVQAADKALVQNGVVYNLGTGVPILKAKTSGGTLTFVVGQKGYNSAVPTNGVLARVALDLQSGANPGLVVFNTSASANKLLTDSGTLADITPEIGALKVQ